MKRDNIPEGFTREELLDPLVYVRQAGRELGAITHAQMLGDVWGYNTAFGRQEIQLQIANRLVRTALKLRQAEDRVIADPGPAANRALGSARRLRRELEEALLEGHHGIKGQNYAMPEALAQFVESHG